MTCNVYMSHPYYMVTHVVYLLFLSIQIRGTSITNWLVPIFIEPFWWYWFFLEPFCWYRVSYRNTPIGTGWYQYGYGIRSIPIFRYFLLTPNSNCKEVSEDSHESCRLHVLFYINRSLLSFFFLFLFTPTSICPCSSLFFSLFEILSFFQNF